MLTQALKGAVGSSSCTSIALASSQHSTSLLESSSALCSLEPDAQLHLSVEDDSLDSPKQNKEHETLQGEEDEEPFWLPGCHDQDPQPEPSPYASASAIDALCRSFVASHVSSRPPMIHSASSMDIAGHNSDSTTQFGGMMARSCPKPIIMPRRSRRGSLTTNQEELTVFVPPHEIVASSLMDPTNVSDSLCRKGSAAIRLRSGVLRRTGFLEGHTETLKPQTSLTSFKQ